MKSDSALNPFHFDIYEAPPEAHKQATLASIPKQPKAPNVSFDVYHSQTNAQDLNTAPEQKKEKEEDKDEMVSFLELWRFAEQKDYIYLILGIVFAMVAGCSFPFFALIWGKILDAFLITTDPQARLDQAAHYRNIFFAIGVASLFASWISFGSWTIMSDRMSIACRKAYFKSLLKQDIGWYDMNNQFQLSQKFNLDSLAYQKATGEKVGSMFNLLAMFLCGPIISLAVRWTFALVVLASLPVIGGATFFSIFLVQKKDGRCQHQYQKADISCHQAISAIKTVKSMNGQQFELQKYIKFLEKLKTKVPTFGLLSGIGIALFFFIQYCGFAWNFYFGTNCIAGVGGCNTNVSGSVYTPGQAVIVYFAIIVGSFNFIQLIPNLLAILQGMKAAKRLYAVIDHQPSINTQESLEKGIKKEHIDGHIRFQNVVFAYPKKKDAIVLNRINLDIKPGQISAFVGESGCGKSTIIQLVLRFYDPDEGTIYLDGVDLKEYNITWLRQQFGYVGQEPSLFQGTVFQNVRVGKPDASLKQAWKALALAQANTFVNQLPKGLNYNVGYAGSHLSGGQKQRIAIARALIRQPKILILDQATSALDRRNEKLIQKTLNKLSKGRTTLTVAHRVRTIMGADNINVINYGLVYEKGKFNELERFKDLEYNVEEDDDNNAKSSQKSLNKEQFQKEKNKNEEVIQQESREQQKVEEYKGRIYGRLFQYAQGKQCYIFLCLLCAAVSGAFFPGFSMLMANVINEQFNLYPISSANLNDPRVATGVDQIHKYILGMFLLTLFAAIPLFGQSYLATLVGEFMTDRIRREVYDKMLRLPVQWFQKMQNRGGLAATRFGIDSKQVNSMVSSVVSTLTISLSTIICGLLIALIAQWRLGLIAIVAIPCMICAGFLTMIFYGNFGDQNKPYFQQSSKLSEQGTLNIKTICSNNFQDHIYNTYCQKLQYPLDSAFAKGTKLGCLYGASQLLLQFTFGISFYAGAKIMTDNPDVTLLNIMYAILAIAWAGWYAGNTLYFLPDAFQGKKSAINIFKILDQEDEDQLQVKNGSKMLTKPIEGNFSIQNLSFRYNSTQDLVLKELNLDINKGSKIAFVGPSGCGKSTLIQLIQRFYDYNGQILLDGVELKDYDLYHLRKYLVGVSQQPSLFSGSINYNIQYNSQATEEEIKDTAKQAMAYNFIMRKQYKFQNDVGVKGGQLSGGQKQRIAVSRALLKKPQVLMLDQATSALDRQTEKAVQANIDQAMVGKTSLVIAHRIETILNSNRIYMFDKGQIIEQGSYSQLVDKKQHFYNMQRGQKLTR